MLQVSTDEVYGAVLEGSSIETDQLEPRSPYSASKAGGELHVPGLLRHLRYPRGRHTRLQHLRPLPVS